MSSIASLASLYGRRADPLLALLRQSGAQGRDLYGNAALQAPHIFGQPLADIALQRQRAAEQAASLRDQKMARGLELVAQQQEQGRLASQFQQTRQLERDRMAQELSIAEKKLQAERDIESERNKRMIDVANIREQPTAKEPDPRNAVMDGALRFLNTGEVTPAFGAAAASARMTPKDYAPLVLTGQPKEERPNKYAKPAALALENALNLASKDPGAAQASANQLLAWLSSLPQDEDAKSVIDDVSLALGAAGLIPKPAPPPVAGNDWLTRASESVRRAGTQVNELSVPASAETGQLRLALLRRALSDPSLSDEQRSRIAQEIAALEAQYPLRPASQPAGR